MAEAPGYGRDAPVVFGAHKVAVVLAVNSWGSLCTCVVRQSSVKRLCHVLGAWTR